MMRLTNLDSTVSSSSTQSLKRTRLVDRSSKLEAKRTQNITKKHSFATAGRQTTGDQISAAARSTSVLSRTESTRICDLLIVVLGSLG